VAETTWEEIGHKVVEGIKRALTMEDFKPIVQKVLKSPFTERDREELEQSVTEFLRKNPQEVMTLEAFLSGLNPASQAAGFAMFFLEEGAQAVMFAAIGAQQAKNYTLLKKLTEVGYKIYDYAMKMIEAIGLLNPLMSTSYIYFFDGFKAFLDAASEIAVTGKPTWGEKTLWDMRSPEGEEHA